MSFIVEAKGLVKKYGDETVVDGISFEIQKGECFGILGPNGAGKSTTLKMMYCSTPPTDGELYLMGLNAKENMREVKSRIGVIPQDDSLDTDFTVEENLLMYSRYFAIDPQIALRRAEDLLRLTRLEDDRHSPIEILSGGMRRRLAVARGMINHPELLILDEPSAGLDPQARIWIWSFLKKIKQDMGTLIITTHYMEEAEQLCDRIAMMDKGKILSIGTPAELIAKHIGSDVVEFDYNLQDVTYHTNRLKEQGLRYQIIGSGVSIHLDKDQDPKKVLNSVTSSRVTLRKPNLNDVFLKLAGHDLKENLL